jgi:excisionase family DNA binding protein
VGAKKAVEAAVESEYLTVAETGTYSRHGERTVWRWLASGELPFHRIGRRVLVKRSDVDAFLEAGRVDPKGKK